MIISPGERAWINIPILLISAIMWMMLLVNPGSIMTIAHCPVSGLGGINGFISDDAGDEPGLFPDSGLGADAGRDDVADADRARSATLSSAVSNAGVPGPLRFLWLVTRRSGWRRA